MLYSCHGHIEISQKIPRWQAREWIDMAKVYPFKFTTTKATEKIQLTVEITKELDFGAKAEEEISFGDFNLKIPAVNL